MDECPPMESSYSGEAKGGAVLLALLGTKKYN